MLKTIASSVFMIRPKHFGFNEQTSFSNAFQNNIDIKDITTKAQIEFDSAVILLRNNGIEVFVFEDLENIKAPDAVFPNNWITINNNQLVLYPMLTPNRRAERRSDVINFFIERNQDLKITDLTHFESENKFCEGTGSLVFNHKNKIAYASLSSRTNKEVVEEVCTKLNYQPIYFTSHDGKNQVVYHTNVMMCIGEGFVIICIDAIIEADRENVIKSFNKSGHTIIEISVEQMSFFAGNMLQLQNTDIQKFIVMSETSHKSLSLAQLSKIEQHAKVLVFNVGTIEYSGGGSIRCMLAEVFS